MSAFSPRRTRSPRNGPRKVGESLAPPPNCPPGQLGWRNYFKSGCKPATEDRRSLALQFQHARRGGVSPTVAEAVANGWFSPKKSAKRHGVASPYRQRAYY